MARRREANEQQERKPSSFDSVDLVVGLVLLILVPVVCFAVAGMLGAEGRSSKFDFRQKPSVDPPPDREEVDVRFRSAEAIYTENAQAYLRSLVDRTDSVYAGRLKEWANKSLGNADSALLSLEQLIQSHPESQAEFKGTIDRIASLRGRIKADLERLRSISVVGQDVRR